MYHERLIYVDKNLYVRERILDPAMSPRKQPSSLFNICVKNSIHLINSAVSTIEKKYPDNPNNEYETMALLLKEYLCSMLPARLLDILCLKRTCVPLTVDPCTQLLVLTHPNLTVFHKSDLDNSIPLQFWLTIIPKLTHLVVLDLKFICSDEILGVIGSNCTLLEEINIVSRVDICKSLFNASVLIRNVSDEGLMSVGKLKRLKIVTMDPPRHERINKIGRCVSQLGIILLIRELPHLEELRIDTCDIGSTLISTHIDIGPLSLRKINCHFPSADGIRKLLQICPKLKELRVTHLSRCNKDAVLDEITNSDVKLHRLDLSFFVFTPSLENLLVVKGSYLTHFSLWEIEHSLTFDTIFCIGENCPNLNTLCLVTQSSDLLVPRYFQRRHEFFATLRVLTIGNGNFNIDHILSFFLECTSFLQKLVVKYQTKTSIDGTILQLLRKGYLKEINYLWLDCTLEISKDVVLEVIKMCDKLRSLTVDFSGSILTDIYKVITDNNLDLKLGSY